MGDNREAPVDSPGRSIPPAGRWSGSLGRLLPACADDTSAKLEELADLHAKGVLSDEEFAAAKAKALGI